MADWGALPLVRPGERLAPHLLSTAASQHVTGRLNEGREYRSISKIVPKIVPLRDIGEDARAFKTDRYVIFVGSASVSSSVSSSVRNMRDSNVGVMTAFAESSRSGTAKSSEMTGRLRPIAASRLSQETRVSASRCIVATKSAAGGRESPI